MQASKKEIIEQAKYINILAKKILDAANNINADNLADRNNGTIKNLAPELSKEASKIKKMCSYGWK